jgi:ketosteroid isomerase-like protein
MNDPASIEGLNAWMEKYKAAWESRDPAAAANLFTGDAEYYWTPFEEPKRGHAQIAKAWEAATSRQQDISFSFTVLAAGGSTGIVHWKTSFIRITTGKHVELDGILRAEFDKNHKCRVFREWWHSSE